MEIGARLEDSFGLIIFNFRESAAYCFLAHLSLCFSSDSSTHGAIWSCCSCSQAISDETHCSLCLSLRVCYACVADRSATKGAVVFGWNTHGYREEFYREESHCWQECTHWGERSGTSLPRPAMYCVSLIEGHAWQSVVSIFSFHFHNFLIVWLV